MTNKMKKKTKSFEEMCIQTGYKPVAAQGIDFSQYDYTKGGNIIKRVEVIPFGSGRNGGGGQGYNGATI